MHDDNSEYVDEFNTAIPVINSTDKDDNPSVGGDELLIVFSSNRPNPNGLFDLWYAVRNTTADVFSEPLLVPVVNSPHDERESWISHDGCEIFFSSDRPGGQGGLDIYHSRVIPAP